MVQKTVSIFGKISTGSESAVLQELQRLDTISDAQLLVGKYDFYARISTDEPEQALDNVKAIEGISKLHVMLPRDTREGE